MLAPRPSSPDAWPRVPISFPLCLRPTPYIEQHGFRGAIHFPAHLLGPRCSVRPGLAWIPYVLAIVWIPYVQVIRALYTFCSYGTSHMDVGGFYTFQPLVDLIRPGHCMDSLCPSTRGFYTSWPFGLHVSQPSVDSIHPAHMDVPLSLWIPYVPPTCGFYTFRAPVGPVRQWHLSPSVGL